MRSHPQTGKWTSFSHIEKWSAVPWPVESLKNLIPVSILVNRRRFERVVRALVLLLEPARESCRSVQILQVFLHLIWGRERFIDEDVDVWRRSSLYCRVLGDHRVHNGSHYHRRKFWPNPSCMRQYLRPFNIIVRKGHNDLCMCTQR